MKKTTNEQTTHEQEKLDLRWAEAGAHPAGAAPSGGWSLKRYLRETRGGDDRALTGREE